MLTIRAHTITHFLCLHMSVSGCVRVCINMVAGSSLGCFTSTWGSISARWDMRSRGRFVAFILLLVCSVVDAQFFRLKYLIEIEIRCPSLISCSHKSLFPTDTPPFHVAHPLTGCHRPLRQDRRRFSHWLSEALAVLRPNQRPDLLPLQTQPRAGAVMVVCD